MIKLETVKFGTDAEFFLKSCDGRPFPACGLVGGTKSAPRPLDRKGFFVQEDNAALEVNIPPSNSFRNIRDSLEWIKHHCQAMLPPSLTLDEENSSIVFPHEYLNIPQINVMGCEPDYNAFSMTANPRSFPKEKGLRTASAHVHIGWDNPTEEDRINLIRMSDIFVILPEISHQKEDEARRRELYGKSGAFRWKPYGVEHRTPSNKWVMDSHSIPKFLQKYLYAIAAVNLNVPIDPEDYKRIQQAINNPHPKLAVLLHQKYTKRLNEAVPKDWDWYTYFHAFK